MGLNIASLIKRQPRSLVDLADQKLLRLGAGLGEHGGVAVLVGTDGPDHGPDHVAVPHRRSDGLKHEREEAFPAGVPVGALVEAVTPPVGGQEAAA